MAQFIEADSTLPSQVRMARNDVLLVRAFGGQIDSGRNVVEVLGPMTSAVLQTTGSALSPEGTPNAVMFIARDYGTAKANVVFGDPWYSPQKVEFEIVVE
jgi:hypothetical protein